MVELCIYCGEPICSSEEFRRYGTGQPAHIECFMAPVIGSIDFPAKAHRPQGALSRRESAREAYANWTRRERERTRLRRSLDWDDTKAYPGRTA